MGTLNDFVDIFNAFSERQNAALAGVASDITNLKNQLSGQLTPEQQALVDGVLAKVQGATEALEALDAQTP